MLAKVITMELVIFGHSKIIILTIPDFKIQQLSQTTFVKLFFI